MTTCMPNIAGVAPAHRNSGLLQLRHVGDGRVVYRALARIIVRRELISMGIINDPDVSADSKLAA